MALSSNLQRPIALPVTASNRNRRGRFSDRLFYHIFRTGALTTMLAVLAIMIGAYIGTLHGDLKPIATNSFESLFLRLGIFILFLISLILFASWVSSRSLSSLLSNLAQVAIKIGDGDWTARAPMQGPVEFRTLAYRLNSTAELMQRLLKTITKGSLEMKTATEKQIEIATATSERAAELARSAANIDERTAQVSSLVASAQTDMELAYKAFDNYVEASRTRDQRMNQVDEILLLLNNIATQTELLSLNAALEAERAGPSARGLAAIAEEIRRMAEDTKLKSKDIANVIGEAQSLFAEVDASQQIASQQLTVSLKSLHKVTEARTHVTAATADQVTATRQVVHDMKHITYGSGRIAEIADSLSSTRLFLHHERRK